MTDTSPRTRQKPQRKPFKKQPTKAQVRDELKHDIAAFIERGGTVKEVEVGASALENGKLGEAPQFNTGEPKASRTPVPDVVAAIEQRRQNARTKPTPTRRKRPRKKIIYDDFGDPIREIWVDE